MPTPAEAPVATIGRPGRKRARYLLAIAVVTAAVYAAPVAYRLARWRADRWLPSYLASAGLADDPNHLIFVIADHYEPGPGAAGERANAAWLSRFRPIADHHRDSAGNRFRYTWFYPFDNHSQPVLDRLSRMAYDGYGEVELHWHHPIADDRTFPAMLDEALAWFGRRGALVSSGDSRRTHFGFIHGNWALDGSDPRCGVGGELEILRGRGCYADFTFSAIGTASQPKKVNALYYVHDTLAPKSYDDGEDAEVGRPGGDRILIFEGPTDIDWATGRIESGAIEDGPVPDEARVDRWIGAGIHVRGRPEWAFVKLYTHGIQAADVLLGDRLGRTLDALERRCRSRGIALHYMTAREAYNVVKAAVSGRQGDPESYRDFLIPKPRNMVTPN